jgi:hypothetical protein
MKGNNMSRDSNERSSRRGRDDEPERGRGRDREEPRGRGRDDGDDRPARGRSDSDHSIRYEYHARDAGDTKRRSSQGANDFDKILVDSVKMWKPNDGDNRIRILPPTWEKAKHFGLDIYVHYAVGPDRQTYLCLQKMKNEADPIAEEREIARRDEDETYAKQLEAKRRVLVYIIDRDHEKDGVQAWAMPWTVDRDIVKVSVDKGTGEVLPIDHPEDGYDVEFEKKGAKDRTEYLGVAIARRSSPLGKSDWLNYAIDNPLPEQLNYFDYDHIAKVFNGGGAHKEKSREEPRGRDDARGDREESRSRSGGNSRDDNHGRASESSRGREEEPRGKSRSSEEPTWDSVHAMTGDELEDLIEQEKLDINPKEAKDDEDLADWICEEMKLKKVEKTARRATSDSDDSDRLRRMRGNRD